MVFSLEKYLLYPRAKSKTFYFGPEEPSSSFWPHFMVVSVNVCADAVLKTAILDTASYLGLGEIFTRLYLNLAY